VVQELLVESKKNSKSVFIFLRLKSDIGGDKYKYFKYLTHIFIFHLALDETTKPPAGTGKRLHRFDIAGPGTGIRIFIYLSGVEFDPYRSAAYLVSINTGVAV
jgi:hypothetical protein